MTTPEESFGKWWFSQEPFDLMKVYENTKAAYLAGESAGFDRGRESGLQEAAEVAMYEAGEHAHYVSQAILRLKGDK